MKTMIKTRVQTLMDSYMIINNELAAKIKDWENDQIYAADYKQEKIEKLQDEAEKTDALFNGKLQEIIATEKKAIIGTPASKPADYQMQIANALEFIKLAGNNLNDAQALGILKPFQNDPETMQLFQAVVGGLTEGGGIWNTFEKTFGKTNEFMVLMSNIEIAEQTANNLFDSKETGLKGAIKASMFVDSIDTIDKVANDFDAA